MKILYISFACSPLRGSECLIGWEWPFGMRDEHEVYVLTRGEFKEEIKTYMKENNIHNIHMLYCDVPIFLEKPARKIWVLYYRLWQQSIKKIMPQLIEKYQFDLIHHVTMNEYRTVENKWKGNAKFIFGPTGGAQLTPKYLKEYTKQHWFEENIREFINRSVVKNKKYIKKINNCDYIVSANKETIDVIKNIINDDSKCSLMLDVGINDNSLQNRGKCKNCKSETFTFLWAGRMVYRKGLMLLLEALNMVDRKLDYKLLLCGNGPQKDELIKKVEKFNLQDKVEFVGSVPYENMGDYYQKSNAFIFPSLRETCGTVILESMSYAVPVIGFQNGGFSTVVTENEGFFIKGNSKEETISSLKEIIEYCISNPEIVECKGNKAYKLVSEKYTWSNKINEMKQIYANVVK